MVIASDVVSTRLAGKAVPASIVGTTAAAGVVPTTIVGTVVPTIIVLTAYYWKSCVFTIKLYEYFLDTFTKVLSDELNKLEHKNSDKIKDINEIDNKVPESRRYSNKN